MSGSGVYYCLCRNLYEHGHDKFLCSPTFTRKCSRSLARATVIAQAKQFICAGQCTCVDSSMSFELPNTENTQSHSLRLFFSYHAPTLLFLLNAQFKTHNCISHFNDVCSFTFFKYTVPSKSIAIN